MFGYNIQYTRRCNFNWFHKVIFDLIRLLLEPPAVVTNSSSLTSSQSFTTENTILSCTARGYPLPVITWLLNGLYLPGQPSLNSSVPQSSIKNFQINNRVTNSVLTSLLNITSVVAANAGTYTCRIANSFGVASYQIALSVQTRSKWS